MDFNNIKVTGNQFTLPRLTQIEIDALTGIVGGWVVFNTDTNLMQTWSGATWDSSGESYNTVGGGGATDINLPNTSVRLFVEHSVPFTLHGAVSPDINIVYEIIDAAGIAGTTLITFNGNGKTIRGLSTWDLDADWYVLKVVYNGTEYNII